nr:MAG TPA: hypothetical protein [Caudoviricetes sp.]
MTLAGVILSSQFYRLKPILGIKKDHVYIMV